MSASCVQRTVSLLTGAPFDPPEKVLVGYTYLLSQYSTMRNINSQLVLMYYTSRRNRWIGDTSWEDPPPCNSGIIRIEEDPNIIPIIPYSHYYWVGGPPKIQVGSFNLQTFRHCGTRLCFIRSFRNKCIHGFVGTLSGFFYLGVS